jgi:hypothetical protein
MWAREQSVCFLKQYIRARNNTRWVTNMCPGVEQRARETLQYLGGMAGDWYGNRSNCHYYYPQRNANERKV